MQRKARQLQRRLAVVGQRAAHRQAVAPHRRRHGVGAGGDAALHLTHAAHLALELGLGMVVGRDNRLGGFLEIMKLAQLVGDRRHDLLHGQANRPLGVGQDGQDRHRQRRL